jgi:hypothetical protein
MVPVDATTVSLELNVLIAASYEAQIREEEPRYPIHLFGSPERLAGGKDDLVITPGGPRPRDQVHHVGPGEALRQNEDGTYSIVPADTSKNPPNDSAPKDEQKKDK